MEIIEISPDGQYLVCGGHEDSGLIQLFVLLSDTQYKQELHRKLEEEQLNIRI